MKRFALLLILSCFITPVSSAAKLEWRSDYSLALEESKRTGKPIFIDCFADWCTWCHKLDQEVYNTPQFIQFMNDFIPVRIDVEDNAEGTRLAAELEVNDLPTVLIIDPTGKVVNRIGGYLAAEPLMEDIAKIQKMLAQEKAEPPDLTAIYELGKEYLARDMHEESEQRFRIVAASPGPSRQKESALFSLAMAQYYQRKFQDALLSLEKFRNDFQQSEDAEDALLLLSEIHLEMDSHEQAKLYLSEFLQKYPDSGNAHRAREVLDLLEKKR